MAAPAPAGFDADDSVSATISGLTSYEYITDGLDSTIFKGKSVTLTAAEVNNGLTLHSTYAGKKSPVNTLTVTATATDPSAGGTVSSASKTITVTDPPPGPPVGSLTASANGGTDGSIDFSKIGFGANTTLGYSANSNNTGGMLTVSDSLHAQSIALLGQYMASSFVMASDGHGGTLVTDPSPLTSQQQPLAHPYA